MGGGDLNMKKHFHPLTMENLERVWNAEEKKRLEDERIQQLQQELAAEREREHFEKQAIQAGLKKKKGEKLDWMYQGHQNVDTEAYLLGKKIDKNIDVAKEEEKGLSSGVIAPIKNASIPKANDILAKIKEDPLFMIKKKEEDNRKLLMANPMKLRKMKALVEQQASSLKRERKSHKKRKKSETSSSSSSDSSDNEKMQRKHHSRKHINESLKSYDKTSHCTEDELRITHSYHQRKTKDREMQDYRSRSYKRFDKESTVHRDNDSRVSTKNGWEKHCDSDKYGRVHDRDNRLDRNHSKRDYDEYRNNIMHHHQAKYRSKEKEHSYRRRKHSSSSSESEDDELEAKRNEMMNNAKWRQSQRSQNIKNHKTEKEAEERKLKTISNITEEKAYFVQKLQKDSVTSLDSSVEDRIHRNIHSKQRTNIALDKKFTAR